MCFRICFSFWGMVSRLDPLAPFWNQEYASHYEPINWAVQSQSWRRKFRRQLNKRTTSHTNVFKHTRAHALIKQTPLIISANWRWLHISSTRSQAPVGFHGNRVPSNNSLHTVEAKQLMRKVLHQNSKHLPNENIIWINRIKTCQ